VYNDHDRPSTQRIIITAAASVAAIAAIIAFAAVVFGMTTSSLPSTGPAPVAAVAVQTPATATTQIAQSQPAPSAQVGTAAVASDPAPKPQSTPAAPVAPAPAAAAPVSGAGLGVVVIDAGHQGSQMSGTEPVGPGSSVRKPKVESGTSGVATHVDESQRNLEVALVLRKALEARGVPVVMVRTSQDVKIANSQRAKIANDANAALFVRLHCDSGPSSATGILTLRPAKNWYSGSPIVAKSAVAAKLVQRATIAATGAKDRGITPRSDLSGFNWSKVPSVLVEMGMMSNAAEDRKMATAAYQQKLADGMANGIVAYLKSK
jgi:N-acetylmuramoyl-L-alanine amidase